VLGRTASLSNVSALLARAVLGSLLICLAGKVALSGPGEPVVPETTTPAKPTCDSDDIVVYQSSSSSPVDLPCAVHSQTLTEAATARAYLVETARPGYTMRRQGPELAIGRLHPVFVVRLANAVREAKQAGLAYAGIHSAYRPPAFGIGGFVDKFHSLHTYGLAVDMHGIGGPGTPEAQLWHDIAARHGIVCPYGPQNPAEWNHCQPTRVKIILAESPLRETVKAEGPISLEDMFEIGNALIAGNAVGPNTHPPAQVIPSQQGAAATRAKSIPAPQVGRRIAHNGRAPQRSRSRARGLAFKWPPLARPPAIYVEEGRRSGLSSPSIQTTLHSTSRSAVRSPRPKMPRQMVILKGHSISR
jgi:hypothetical protein